jgi:hypothetical protein
MAAENRFELSTSVPAPLRVMLGGIGAFIACIVVKELWRAVWPPSVLTPLFLIILCGGLLIGLTLVIAMIWGPDERWVIAPGRVIITRTLRSFCSEKAYSAADILSAQVVDNPSDGGPDTFELVIRLNIGRTLRSPNFSTHGAAESARRMLLGI